MSRPAGTGVLLAGEKGSGKTMLAKLTCQALRERHGIPTIFVTQPWGGDGFIELIGNVNQPAVVLFDEFEKVYSSRNQDGSEDENHHTQDSILTLLDGIFTTKKLFILTANDRYALNDYLINRPGRLYYSFEFRGIGEKFIREYCADRLKDVSKTNEVTRAAGMFRSFNFDMLQALVEEMNRYDEGAKDALRYLNINPVQDYAQYGVSLIPAGFKEPVTATQPNRVYSPLTKEGREYVINTYSLPHDYSRRRAALKAKQDIKPTDEQGLEMIDSVTYSGNEPSPPNKKPRDGHGEFRFSTTDIKHVTDQTFELVNADGDQLILQKHELEYDWRAI
jgi:energy-coupling factor transporter ATP-binding protein EcfA2